MSGYGALVEWYLQLIESETNTTIDLLLKTSSFYLIMLNVSAITAITETWEEC
jgi:hypothetical protein